MVLCSLEIWANMQGMRAGGDVSPERDFERELARVQRRNKQLKDSSSLALVEIDMEGKLAAWNRQAEVVFGWPEAEALGRHFALIVPEPARPQVDMIFQALASGEVRHSRNINVRKDGRPIVCQWYNAVLRDDEGVVRLIYCEVRDVTEEEELRRRQQLMQALADHSPLAIFAKDPAGRYLYANEEFTRGLGRPLSEVLGRGDLDLYGPELAEERRRDDAAALAADSPLTREQRGIGADGERSYWSLTFPLRDSSGQITAICGIVNDITSLKRAEVERAALQQQMIDSQRQALVELSTPLIPVADGVLAMPLIGAIDQMRAALIMETLLAGVVQQRARAVIIDITGVRTIDVHVAEALLRSARAVRLLGAETVITGVGPAVAQTLVQLGVDLRDLVTLADLRSGIAHALARGSAIG
jgi:rsbT co-antagonist protein RsbR